MHTLLDGEGAAEERGQEGESMLMDGWGWVAGKGFLDFVDVRGISGEDIQEIVDRGKQVGRSHGGVGIVFGSFGES